MDSQEMCRGRESKADIEEYERDESRVKQRLWVSLVYGASYWSE